MDLLADLALLGNVIAELVGHAMHAALVARIMLPLFSCAPEGKAGFLTPECDESAVRCEKDEAFRFGNTQQQTVKWITVRFRALDAG